jgi:acyl dehydratase
MNPEIEKRAALYLEDLQIAQRFTSGEYEMTEERIKTFAAEFDPQPFHLDESAAQESVFRGLAASGWHTAAVSMRLLVTSGLPLQRASSVWAVRSHGHGQHAQATC